MPSAETFTAAELQAMRLDEPRCVVDGLISEGMGVLAGKPKLGKSWMALNISIAIASGDVALGGIPVDTGPVLYLALEDTKRRLQSRLAKLLGTGDVAAPADLTMAVQWARQDKGGLADIADWLLANPVRPPGGDRHVGEVQAVEDPRP
ncbi:MAG: helicase RepA family protein [Gemmataceae bacterium]|nr:helicase RepA family protein [Gemmataceae bacterium]